MLSNEPEWFHAMTLAERSAARPRPPSVVDDERAEYRLRTWKSQPPFDDPSYFERRLALNDLTEARLRGLLSEPPEAVRERMPEPPWLTRVRLALGSPGSVRLSELLPRHLRDSPNGALLTVAHAFIAAAVARLERMAGPLAASLPSAPFEPKTIAKILFPALADAMLDMLRQALVLDLNIARVQGELRGATPEDRFANFVERMSDPDRVRTFFREYPVLARLLVEQADRWVEVSQELLERLCRDSTTLRAAFTPGADLGILVGATGGLADSHRGGRSVIVLKFSSGIRIVYKPKSLAVDAHFQDLLQFLNARGAQPPFRVLTVLDRGSYGWTEYIESRECATADEVRRFYRRQGANVALLYVLAGTDFHSGNVIASGEHPVLVDLEALFCPHRSRHERGGPEADRIARRVVSESVLSIDLLPERVWSNEEHAGVDISGLGTPDGQWTPHRLPQWEHAGTDTMRLVRGRKPIGTRKNHPRYSGAAANALDYRREIADGFAAMYGTLEAARGELLSAEGPLTSFRGDEISVFVRSSRTYRRLLRESHHPDLLRDALDRERHFDLLWIEVEDRPELVQVIRAECEDLLRGDIPVFTTQPDSRDLRTSHGFVPDFFDEAGLSVARRRIEGLGERDLARQMWFVNASLATLCPDGPDRAGSAAPLPDVESDRDRLMAAAAAAGDRLEAIAVRGTTDATWIGLDLESQGVWSIGAAGLDVDGGLPGIALFLAYLGLVTRREKYTALARAALVTIRSLVQRQRSSVNRIGAFDGWGGLIYVLTHLGAIWDRPDLIAEAESLVDGLPELIERDDALDVKSGAAGCIAALRCLHQFAPADRLAAVAIQCGDHLIAGRDRGTRRPTSGFAHGAAGVCWGLFRLYAWTGLDRFHSAAVAAWEDERARRAEDVGSPPPTDWWRGASGVGLAFSDVLDLVDRPDIRGEIYAALEIALREGFGHNHSLGHGDLGSLELLLRARTTFGDKRCGKHARRGAAAILDSIESDGWRSGAPFAVETPGLMTGLAGIGYELLRLAAPDLVPCVLLLEPPALERRGHHAA